MNSNYIFGVSLTASFLAGVLALFAPCCITFLFPSYLGTIFRERKRVMLYTLIFALGLSSILIPIALGFRVFIFFFDTYHKEIYYLGAIVLIAMGIATLKPFFHLPQFFRFNPKLDKNINIGSVFGLGIMSGLASSCCAPVLFAAVTLTTLSPTILQAFIVSLAYVLGIVSPLFLLSLFYEKITNKIFVKNRQKIYHLFQIFGTSIFILSGILIAVWNFTDKIQMYQMEEDSKLIRLFIFEITKNFSNPWIDLLTFGIIVLFFFQLIKRVKK